MTILSPPTFVPTAVAARGDSLPSTEAVEKAIMVMTGREWRKLAQRFVIRRHPYWEPLLDGYCPGVWQMLTDGDGSDEDREARYRIGDELATLGLMTSHCRPLEPAFDDLWGHCPSCGFFYRYLNGSVYRIADWELAREVVK